MQTPVQGEAGVTSLVTGIFPRTLIGIGGWTFAPWRGTFYPKGLPHAQELYYASRQITSIEINGTFYRTQDPASFATWRDTAPPGFVFSIKASRGTTHLKDITAAAPAIERFLGSGLLALGPALGPILWQFPHTKKFDPAAFAAWLRLLPKDRDGMGLRHVVEARHPSFTDPAFIGLLREYGVANAIIGSDKHVLQGDLTAPFVYVRLQHNAAGGVEGYDGALLDRWAERARAWQAGRPVTDLPLLGTPPDPAPRDCFIYFIGGDKERAPDAARALLKRL